MRVWLYAVVAAVLELFSATRAHSLPLFDARNDALSIPTLHTSLSTLLPVLPELAPAPSHTLLVTLATPGYKHLLYNWFCYLRHKAKWANKSRLALPVLVITSDDDLARELSDHGVVTWFLKATDLSQFDNDEEEEGDDLFEDALLSLRIMDLLLSNATKANVDMVRWGSLRYQALMLERTLAMSLLVGALAETQRVDTDIRLAQEERWKAMLESHKSGPVSLTREPYVGVKGVLLADHDAVWMSSPHAFLDHHYRHAGPHPSMLWAPDMYTDLQNAWGGFSMPCACFLYSRVDDDLAHTARGLPFDPDEYRPAQLARRAWQLVSLCHIVVLLESLEDARDASERIGRRLTGLEELARARAPSFQATALGPALFLASQGHRVLPDISFHAWSEALASGDPDQVHEIIRAAGLDETTCLALAKETTSTCAARLSALESPQGHTLRQDALPYDYFPPGMSYFRTPDRDGKLPNRSSEFVEPCVIHANYALGAYKEELLRQEDLWALVADEDSSRWSCDAQIMSTQKG